MSFQNVGATVGNGFPGFAGVSQQQNAGIWQRAFLPDEPVH